METMLCAVSGYWDEEKGAWIVTVTSDMIKVPCRRYKIRACDEFVAPIAICETHGYDVMRACGNPEGWAIEEIKN